MLSGFRTVCKACITRLRRERYQADPEFRQRLNAISARSYEKHSERRIAESVGREALIKSSDEGREKFKAAKARQHAARLQDAEWVLRRREQMRVAEAARLADPAVRQKKNQQNTLRRASDPQAVKAHRLRSLKWAKENPHHVRANRHRRRARVALAEGSYTAADLAEILDAQNYKCFWCDADISGGKHTVDHLTPLVRGGSNDRLNIAAACMTCNCRKGRKTADEFQSYLKKTAR
jgi:5-methylcytosine-specific restriction endonuclease McrA